MDILSKYRTALKGQKRPFRFLLSRILMVTGISRFLYINRRKYRLRFYPSPHMADLWIHSDYRRDEEPLFEKYLRKGDVVVDVGANVGLLTLLSSVLVGNSGKVFSIEANPRVFRYLAGNIAANRLENVVSFNVALGEEEGHVLFSDERWDEVSGVVSRNDNGRPINIAVRKLDSLPIAASKINLLKIDVEGYEKYVIAGGTQVIQNTECVYFESNEHHFANFGYTCDDLFQVLRAGGFQLYKILDENVLSILPKQYISTQNENLLAIRDRNQFVSRTGYSFQQ
jgi:FkbM family methyltransferase